jgi:hypothetical protein
MKAKSWSVLMAASFLVMGLTFSPLAASEYLGEVTWNGVDNAQHTFTVKAGISKVGGSYYEVQGQILNPPGGGPAIFSGGGVLVGTNLILTAAMTMKSGNQTMVMQITIDQSTFSGNFWFVNGFTYIPKGDPQLSSISEPLPSGDQLHAGYQVISQLGGGLGNPTVTGSLTCTSTPFPLASSSKAVTSPLLLD